jgi:CO/xanthine dehydrogenase Mo-binding subunit
MRRSDGAEKVRGTLAFTEDMPLARLAHARLVLSYVASGSIAAIRAEAAARMPGVVGVVTGEDLGLEGDNPELPMARRRVFHTGQPVAAVIAESAQAAADAAALVEVEYETTDAAVDMARALDDDAPLVLPAAEGESEASLHGAGGGEDGAEKPAGNVSSRVHLTRGDPDLALAEAAAVQRERFSFARVHHAFIEPHVASASVEADGSVTVWSPTQAMGDASTVVARSLRVDPSRVRVVPMPVGGGFGGKIVQIEPLVAHLARHVGRPVRLALTRNEEFLLGRPAPSSEVSVELAAGRDGDFVAVKGEIEYDNGAATGWHGGLTAELLVSTYRVPNFDVSAREVATNKLPATAYRAPGAPQAYFALESCVDELARELGIDPIELRLRNASREGDPRGDGSPWPRIGLVACLEAAARHPVYTDPRAPGEGIGVAVGSWPGGYGPAAAACRVEADGTLSLHLGSIDISGSDSAFRAVAAEAFGVSPESVRIRRTDSATSPVSPAAAGSSTTYSVGPAVRQAVLEVRRQVLDVASTRLEAAADDLELVDGEVRVKGAPFRSVSVADIARASLRNGGQGPIHAIGRASVNLPAPMFCVHIARVRVDEQTGAVQVTRYGAVHDIGHPLSRDDVLGQIHGGIVQGLGRALGEELAYDDAGQLRTASFADYMVPTADVVPEIDVQLVEVPSEAGVNGARGIGEPPVVPVLAAIGNAIRDATGRRLTSIPFSAEAIARRT